MESVNKFSGNTAPIAKGPKFDWEPLADGNIYKALVETDYSNVKGFLTSMTRWANETNHSVTRYVSPDGEYVEFSFIALPVDQFDNEDPTI